MCSKARYWCLNVLFLGIFLLYVYVVGEVTYVELFKDAEGKSRVSAVGNNLLEV